MGVVEIISGICLLIACTGIIVLQLMQETKQPGMNSAIGGGSNDSFFDKNSSRTKEATLKRMTKGMAIVFFVVTLLVNLLPLIIKE